MKLYLLRLTLLSILNISTRVDAGRILGLFVVPSRSHTISIQPLFHELAEKGHDVKVVSMFSEKTSHPKYKHVVIDQFITLEDLKLDLFKMSSFQKNGVTTPFLMFYLGMLTCTRIFELPQIKELLASEEKYDVIIFENFFCDCLYGIYYKFKAPMIVFMPNTIIELAGDPVGNPSFYSYVPDLFTQFSDHMTFPQRLHNTLLNIWYNLWRHLYYLPKINAIMKEQFQKYEPNPNVYDVEKTVSLAFLNSHPTVHYPRPLTPNTIPVGGMHIKPAKPLPKHLLEFADNSKLGLIYFSLGSNAQSSNLPEEIRDAFLLAFSKVKLNVLWKWEADNLPGQPKNVKIEKWLPQADILGHPNVRLFITHGGLHSLQEAVYNGVPVIGIPVMGDQNYNLAKVERSGYGLRLDLSNITAESIDWAITTILSQSSYKQKAEELKNIMKDEPMSPLERATFWTEHVMRHSGAEYLRSASVDLTWYQRSLLDVFAVILAIVLTFLYVIYRSLKSLLFRKKDSKKTVPMKKKKK